MAQLKISSAMSSRIENAASEIKELKHTIETLNPKNTLKRGYAIIQDTKRGALTAKSTIIAAHDIIINMHDGEIAAKVTEEKDA
jgi:exonuclease VII large subunit